MHRILNFTSTYRAFSRPPEQKTEENMWSKKDLEQFSSKGISIETIESQLNDFKNGFPFTRLHEPATRGHGILSFNEKKSMS